MMTMLSFLHRLSAILFYATGLSFFLSYVLLKNNGGMFFEWWLRVADLPLIFLSLLYGGVSLHRSLQLSQSPKRGIAFVIALPLVALFVLLAILNFWGIVSL